VLTRGWVNLGNRLVGEKRTPIQRNNFAEKKMSSQHIEGIRKKGDNPVHGRKHDFFPRVPKRGGVIVREKVLRKAKKKKS